MIKKILKDILTIKNGEDYDYGKVVGLVVTLWFMVLVTINVIMSHSLNSIEVGTAIGIILAATGVNLKLKETTEPDKNANPAQ